MKVNNNQIISEMNYKTIRQECLHLTQTRNHSVVLISKSN